MRVGVSEGGSECERVCMCVVSLTVCGCIYVYSVLHDMCLCIQYILYKINLPQ